MNIMKMNTTDIKALRVLWRTNILPVPPECKARNAQNLSKKYFLAGNLPACCFGKFPAIT